MGAKQLAELDREFNRPGATMSAEDYRKQRSELVRAAKEPEPEAPTGPKYVTHEHLLAVLDLVAREVAAKVGAALHKRDKRIAALEAKPAVAISAAGNLEIDGMEHFAAAVKSLERTLEKPMRPIYDAHGKLIGAKRSDE